MFKNKVVWIIIAIVSDIILSGERRVYIYGNSRRGVKPHGAKLRTNINAVWI